MISPRDHEMFFGALDHKTLPFAERMAIKAVGGMEGDFRDWASIDAWAEAIARGSDASGRDDRASVHGPHAPISG